ncbi:MAG: transcription antitermination factor NusB [Patescibacteria group bacterium]|nr:transcription antitermination factor NusB [Patescibacteria group bacterium]
MANRHLSRSVVLQTLFEWDSRNLGAEGAHAALLRNVREFASGAADLPFMEGLLRGAIERREDLDLIIEKAAPEWPIARIAPVDRNVLRLGLFELLFADRGAVPAKVAINEAIELAKSYGGENSGRFVNGVLGAVYKELGEPGKDEIGRKRKEVPYAEMPVERLGGAVVYSRHRGEVYLALVHDIFGHWTLSKGRVGDKIKGETLEEATVREIQEEMRLNIVLEHKLGENEYVASDPKTGKKRKHVTYFLAQSPHTPVVLKQSGGLDDAKWFKLDDAVELNFYEDIVPLIGKAVELIRTPPKADASPKKSDKKPKSKK